MLKFSGFANLTSCLECCGLPPKRLAHRRRKAKPQSRRRAANKGTESALSKLAVDAEPCPSNASRAPRMRVLRRRRSRAAYPMKGDSCWNNKA